ncbi:hypothetical protein KEM48_001688, partial [Puccinia striiformis f. sp. tritici PST-130]
MRRPPKKWLNSSLLLNPLPSWPILWLQPRIHYPPPRHLKYLLERGKRREFSPTMETSLPTA